MTYFKAPGRGLITRVERRGPLHASAASHAQSFNGGVGSRACSGSDRKHRGAARSLGPMNSQHGKRDVGFPGLLFRVLLEYDFGLAESKKAWLPGEQFWPDNMVTLR